MPAPPARTLPQTGCIEVGEAIAWIGFASAVPVRLWDSELALGLTLWPWFSPRYVQERLRHLQFAGWREDLQYTEEHRRGHRSYLSATLRLAGCRRNPVDIGPSHPVQEVYMGRADPLLRAEAARHRYAWNEIKDGISAAFDRATLAAAELREALAEGKLAAFAVPLAEESAAGETGVRQTMQPAVFAGPVTLTPDGLFPFLPDDDARHDELGPAFIDIMLRADHLARLFPRIPGAPPELPAAAPDRPQEPRGTRAIEARQDGRPATTAPTRNRGRPPKGVDLYMPELRRRLESGEAHPQVTAEARHLQARMQENWPEAPVPSLKTIRNKISKARGQHSFATKRPK